VVHRAAAEVWNRDLARPNRHPHGEEREQQEGAAKGGEQDQQFARAPDAGAQRHATTQCTTRLAARSRQGSEVRSAAAAKKASRPWRSGRGLRCPASSSNGAGTPSSASAPAPTGRNRVSVSSQARKTSSFSSGSLEHVA